DGRRYVAQEKYKVQNGKAIISLTNGRMLQVELDSIDQAASEAATRSGLGNAKVLATVPTTQPPSGGPDRPSLGSLATIRRPEARTSTSTSPSDAIGTPATPGARLDPVLASKFTAAFENVGLFERSLEMRTESLLRIDVTADNEDHVFKAISATSFIYANVPSNLEAIELFMRTSTGGSSGRFQMTKEQAIALANQKIEWYDYFVRNVLY
ncbi:MAG: hypothetical protein LC732_03940, partial [Acidobacteria bacterium]|nr:hypothetical protein [Acidobacteriota bacterium]